MDEYCFCDFVVRNNVRVPDIIKESMNVTFHARGVLMTLVRLLGKDMSSRENGLYLKEWITRSLKYFISGDFYKLNQEFLVENNLVEVSINHCYF